MSAWKLLTVFLDLWCWSYQGLLHVLGILQTQSCVLAHLSNPVPGRHILTPEIFFWRGCGKRKLAKQIHACTNFIITQVLLKMKKNKARTAECLSAEMVSIFIKGMLQKMRYWLSGIREEELLCCQKFYILRVIKSRVVIFDWFSLATKPLLTFLKQKQNNTTCTQPPM